MKATLNEVLNDGEKLTVLDGTTWEVNPADMPTACTWIPTANLQIHHDEGDQMHPYIIHNLENDNKIRARKISG